MFASLSWCSTQDSCDPTPQGTRSSPRWCPSIEMSDRRALQRKDRARGILLNHCLVTVRSCNEYTARGRKRCSDYLCGPTKEPDLVCVCSKLPEVPSLPTITHNTHPDTHTAPPKWTYACEPSGKQKQPMSFPKHGAKWVLLGQRCSQRSHILRENHLERKGRA